MTWALRPKTEERMGVNFIVMIENKTNRTQEEADREFGVHEIESMICPTWEILEFRGQSLARWYFAPRLFVLEEEPERWEAVRKYLVRVRSFFGGGEVLVADDVCWYGLPENGEEDGKRPGYYLPGPIWSEHLQDPDSRKHPELKDIGELEGTIW
jgi:hypothetical protein